LHSVPDNSTIVIPDDSTIVGVPAHIVLRDGKRVVITDPKDVRDPLSDILINLAREVKELRQKLAELTHQPMQEPEVEVAIVLDENAEPGATDSKGEAGSPSITPISFELASPRLPGSTRSAHRIVHTFYSFKMIIDLNAIYAPGQRLDG